MIAYPPQLPCFSIYNASYTQTNTINRTRFLSGRVRPRRNARVVPLNHVFKVHLTDAELELFEGWRTNFVQDVKWFTAKIKTAKGYETRQVRFVANSEQRKWLAKVELWELVTQLETKDQGYINEEETVIDGLGVPYDFGTQVQNILEQYHT